jgi:hypothetical protein
VTTYRFLGAREAQAALAQAESRLQITDPLLAVRLSPLVYAVIQTTTGRLPLQTCVGTLVGPNVLLTASHCLDDADGVTVGNASGCVSSDDRLVAGRGDCPDLALIELCGKTGISSFACVDPIALPFMEQKVEVIACDNLSSHLCPDGSLGPFEGLAWSKASCGVVTSQTAYFCKGSSGSPVLREDAGKLLVVGVMNDGGSCYPHAPGLFSLLQTSLVQAFICEWLQRHPSAKICGINA